MMVLFSWPRYDVALKSDRFSMLSGPSVSVFVSSVIRYVSNSIMV